jgi:hypothetical protein
METIVASGKGTFIIVGESQQASRILRRRSMGCYTEWDAYLDKGSQEYETKKTELDAKLEAVKHIVNYYYGVEGLRVPPASHSGEKAFLEMAHLEFEVDEEDLDGKDEDQIVTNIGRHCTCDGIDFKLIYDLVSLLNIQDNNEAGYARIMMTIANEIRAGNIYSV